MAENKSESRSNVVFANDETTVHILLSPDPVKDPLTKKDVYTVESRTLLPGQYVEEDQVPPYLLEAVKNGDAPTLSLLSEKKAEELSKEAAKRRAEADSTVSANSPARFVSAE